MLTICCPAEANIQPWLHSSSKNQWVYPSQYANLPLSQVNGKITCIAKNYFYANVFTICFQKMCDLYISLISVYSLDRVKFICMKSSHSRKRLRSLVFVSQLCRSWAWLTLASSLLLYVLLGIVRPLRRWRLFAYLSNVDYSIVLRWPWHLEKPFFLCRREGGDYRFRDEPGA